MIRLHKTIGFYPRFCVWELSLACNMRCKHCGSYAGERREDELCYEDQQIVADQLIDLGLEQITLGGGEPTMHPHWHDLGRRFSDAGVNVNFISNGWGWNKKTLEKAQYAGVRNVAFSLDGFREEHDEVRREGSFDRVVRAIAMCVEAGMPCSVATHINALNKNKLREFRDFLATTGVVNWQLQLGNPSGAMCEHTELVIEPEDMLWLVPLIAELKTDAVVHPRVDIGDNIGYFGKYEQILREPAGEGGIPFFCGCAAGMQVIGIESNGGVKGCLSLPSSRHGEDFFNEGSLFDNTLEELWTRPGAFAYNRQFSEDQLVGFCATCPHRSYCRGGCSWTAFSNTGTRFDQPYCFYRQAVEHGRDDLLDDGGFFQRAEAELLKNLDAAEEELGGESMVQIESGVCTRSPKALE